MKDPELLEPIGVVNGKLLCSSGDPGQENCYAVCQEAREGAALNGSSLYSRRQDGRYERLDLSGKGPVMVNSKGFRDGWSRTFRDKAAN